MIIDDGFSGLDAETEEAVFDRVFSRQGLFRRLGTTVILATHAVHRLSYADRIVALDSAGRVAEQGSIADLSLSDGYVGKLAAKSKREGTPTASVDSEDIEPASKPNRPVELPNPKTEVNDLSRPVGELSTYKYYFASIGWSRCFLSLSFLLGAGVSIKLTDLLLTYWTNAVAERGSAVNPFYMGMYGMLTAIGVLSFGAGVYHYFLYVVPGSAEELHARLLHAVVDAPLHFFSSTDTGTTTNR